MPVNNKRTVILLGHAQSGKTSLSESLLFTCAATSRKGSVVDGNTVSDYSWDEIEKRHSINSSLLYCNYENTDIQIIDAPGYADFFGEVICGIRAVDNAVLVVDAISGVEVGTEKAWAISTSPARKRKKLSSILFMPLTTWKYWTTLNQSPRSIKNLAESIRVREILKEPKNIICIACIFINP